MVSLLLVTGLWAWPHGVADLGGGLAAALPSVGRLAGLLASDLLLVQVLLMARVRRWSGCGQGVRRRPAHRLLRGGPRALDRIAALPGYEALLVRPDGRLAGTASVPTLLDRTRP